MLDKKEVGFIRSGKEKSDESIGIYREGSLHFFLKNYYCPDKTFHEIRIGKYIADACDGDTVYEIQTGSLCSLRDKVKYYIENTNYSILIVHPLAAERRLAWIDPESGDFAGKPRKSSKHEGVFDMLSEMFFLKEYIDNDRVRFCFPMMTVTETRILNGWSRDGKKGSQSSDKIPGEIHEVKICESTEDIKKEVCNILPLKFTREDLLLLSKRQGRKLWAIQNLLIYLGIIKKSNSEGRRIVFEKTCGM